MCYPFIQKPTKKPDTALVPPPNTLTIGAGMVMREILGGRQIGPESVSLSRDGAA